MFISPVIGDLLFDGYKASGLQLISSERKALESRQSAFHKFGIKQGAAIV